MTITSTVVIFLITSYGKDSCSNSIHIDKLIDTLFLVGFYTYFSMILFVNELIIFQSHSIYVYICIFYYQQKL